MSHSDDKGLVLPPKLAPLHVVIIPIYKGLQELENLVKACEPLIQELKQLGIRVKLDTRDTQRPGWKFADYELKGVPLRIALGLRDLAQHQLEIARRDTGVKQLILIKDAPEIIKSLLNEIQDGLLQRARHRMQAMSHYVDDYETFKSKLETTGGFIYAHWDGTAETENRIKEETKATIRCIPLNNPQESGTCIYSGKPSTQRVVFARAY